MSLSGFFDRKIRIAFDVDKETRDQIDDLVLLTGAASRAELFRDSLRLYMWWTEKQNDGHEVILRKDGNDTVIELKRA
jgi:metal-responsive CopG/Arc/MetJ family transcriptional regulator